MYIETFKEKQEAIRAQQSQQVTTETTTVATTSNTTPVISEGIEILMHEIIITVYIFKT